MNGKNGKNGRVWWVLGFVIIALTGSIKYTHSVEQNSADKTDIQRIEDRLEIMRTEQREDAKEMKKVLNEIWRDVMDKSE